MKQLAKECGVSYKWLEREINTIKKNGVDVQVIEGVKYSVIPGRLKLTNQSYIWNPKIFYHYYYLPRTQDNVTDRPLQVRKSDTVIFINKSNQQRKII
jgi:hypothetical protein